MAELTGDQSDGTGIDQARALHAAGKLNDAEDIYRALLRHGEDLDAQHGLALLYNQTGRNAEAIPLLARLLELDPDAVSSRLVMARCLAATGELQSAIAECERACQSLPDNAVVWNLAGQLQQQAGDPKTALEYLQRALKLDPAHGPALHNQGIALASLGIHDAAILAYEGALRIMPAAARVHYNYALALQAVGREQDAIKALSRTLDLRPGMADARLRLLHLTLLHCDWTDLEKQTTVLHETLNKLLARDEIGYLSLHILNLLDLPRPLHRELARRLAQGTTRRAETVTKPGTPGASHDGRVRVAYLSPDLGAHAVGGLLKDFFAHHNASKFAVRVFSLRTFDDTVASAIREGAQSFEDFSACSLPESAQRIADFSPDILVDLGGYTQGARTELLAMRLAPVQISWLGYLNTMGAKFIDYLIADDVVVPAAHDDQYDENIARLPRCFLPYSRLDENPGALRREDVGLPDNSFVFASFNNTCKVQPAELRAWIRILRDMPESILWVYDGNREAVRDNLRKAFAMARLGPERLVFAPMLPMPEHLQRMRLADLFLDTFRYNAGATAIAAAQVGLPLLTLSGESLLGRMGASINATLKLEELTCQDVDEYVARAVELARDPDWIGRIKEAIGQANKAGTGLFDTATFVKDLEALFKALFERHKA